MIIVGVGAGPLMLTEEARRAIARARLIYGSNRAIDLAREHIAPGTSVNVIENYRALNELPAEAVVLSTGDPMLSGLGYLDGEVIPGISSLQVACARLKISELLVTAITVHGRSLDAEPIAFELARDRCVFLLTDDGTDIHGLCRILEERGLHRDVAAFRDLGYPGERVVMGDTANPPEAPGLSCVMIGRL